MQKAILKVAQVTPIYKKGDSQLLENYRPVSMLPIFGKLFEKIIYSRLYSFLMTKILYVDNNLASGSITQPLMP